MSRAGLARAEGQVVTSTSATSQVLIQQLDSTTGQLTPAQITVANLFSGGADTPTLNAGASGTQGNINIYPSTASKGHLNITAADNAGDTTTSIVNASQAGARTYTIPDAGTDASFILTAGNQTIAGNKTLTGTTEADVLKVGSSGTVGAFNVFPTTASKGSIRILAADSAGDTVTTITNASQAAARAYTIPDAGADASFVMTAGTQSVGGAKTFTSDLTTTTSNVIIGTAGKGVQIKEGSNARMGTSTLTSGTVTVSNTSVTANTRIFLSRYSPGASTALGTLSVGTVVASTSFVIDSRNPTDATVQTNDVSVVHWILVEPAA